MAEKTLNTRIQLKYDTWANWGTSDATTQANHTKGDLVLKAGELGICYIPANSSSGQATSEPVILLKVGDGSTAFKNLQWVSGKAADVYDWAKASSKPSYSASEISGLSDYINGEISDSNTQYQFVADGANKFKLQSKEVSGSWADVSGQTVELVQDSSDAHKIGLKIGSAAVSTWISIADTTYEFADTYNASSNKGATVATVTNAINALDVSDSAVSGKYVSAVSEEDGKITVSRADLPTSLKNPSSLTIGGKTYDGSAAVSVSASDLGIANAMHFIGVATVAIADGSTTDPVISGYSTKTAGDVVLDKDSSREYVWSGSKWELLGGDSSYKTVQTAVADPAASGSATAFIDSISQDANGVITVSKKNVDLSSKADSDHNHDSVYKKIQTAVADPAADGNATSFISSISQDTQGVITVAKKSIDLSSYLTEHQSIKTLNTNNSSALSVSDSEAIAGSGSISLHKIAKTANVNDLIQTSGDVLVFNCGSSTDLV